MISDLREATRSISRIAILQRDLYVLNAELKAIVQAKRIACAIAGLIFLQMAIGLGLLWVGVILYRSGVSAGSVALLSFLAPAVAAALFFFLADQIGKPAQNLNQVNHETSGSRPTDQRTEEARARTSA
jgi:apolipoprotein N-acyltransferase